MTLPRFWFLAALGVLLVLGGTSPSAQAQAMCADICNPYTSQCNEPCYGCLFDYPDGYCPQQDLYYTSCGSWAGACVRENCTPSWVTQSTTQIGAFSSCFLWPACKYYHSFNIYECDSNQCNINSNFYCRTRCVTDQKGYWGGTINACGCCTVFQHLGGCWGYRCPAN